MARTRRWPALRGTDSARQGPLPALFTPPTKLDPDILRNYSTQAANPNPLEIYPVFVQPADDPADYATLAGGSVDAVIRAAEVRPRIIETIEARGFPRC
jgi:hypothetical protein